MLHIILIAPPGPPPHAAATTPVSLVSLCQACTRTISTLLPELQPHFTMLGSTLSILHTDHSPTKTYSANGWRIDMTLGLSPAFRGAHGMKTLSKLTSGTKHFHWHGYLPSGSCLITSLPEDVAGSKGNAFGASSIAVVPTMRYPGRRVRRYYYDLVSTVMWSLLAEVTHRALSLAWTTELGTLVGGEIVSIPM